jgi:hypothetical protein
VPCCDPLYHVECPTAHPCTKYLISSKPGRRERSGEALEQKLDRRLARDPGPRQRLAGGPDRIGGPGTLSARRRSINRMTDSRSGYVFGPLIRQIVRVRCKPEWVEAAGGGRFFRFRISNRSAFSTASRPCLRAGAATASAGLSLRGRAFGCR